MNPELVLGVESNIWAECENVRLQRNIQDHHVRPKAPKYIAGKDVGI